jgi:uncharacterized protein (TIGR02271 family)
LYDTRAEAEAARQRLSSAVDVESVKIIDKNGEGSGSGNGLLNNVHMSHDDRHAYGEGIRRGGFLLCAEVDGDEDAGEIIRILEGSSSVDLEERQQSWKSEGWAPYSAAGTGSTTNSSSGFQGQRSGTAGMAGSTGTTGNVVEEEHIPIVEEELKVGKREVTRGGARVRSYIREVPVHEEVTLREEHVQVERRPVSDTAARSGTLAGAVGSDLLQERTIEMRETAEEAVVQKVANVREELVVSKTATERTEQIDDTVRRTEVEVDEGARTSGEKSAFGSFGNDKSASASTSPAGSNFERNNNSR